MLDLLDYRHSCFALAELAPPEAPQPPSLKITINDRIDNRGGWRTAEVTLPELDAIFLGFEDCEDKKRAPAYFPGKLIGDRRKKSAVCELHFLAIDLDKGEFVDKVIAAIKAKGLRAVVHSTHSHLTEETEILLDKYRMFTGSNGVTTAGLRRYLLEVERYRPWVVETVEAEATYRDTPEGAVCVARHEPLPKYRVILFLKKPFSRREHLAAGGTQAGFEQLWKVKYAAVANSLGVTWDEQCTDINRAFFLPSCKPGAEPYAQKVDGKLLDLDGVEVEPVEPEGRPAAAGGSNGRCSDVTFQGIALGAWAAQYGSTFEIEEALRSSPNLPSDFFRAARGEGGVHIQCPFEDEHSEFRRHWHFRHQRK